LLLLGQVLEQLAAKGEDVDVDEWLVDVIGLVEDQVEVGEDRVVFAAGVEVLPLRFAVDALDLLAGEGVDDFGAAVVEDGELAKGFEIDFLGEGLMLLGRHGPGGGIGGAGAAGAGHGVHLAKGVGLHLADVAGGLVVGGRAFATSHLSRRGDGESERQQKGQALSEKAP